MKQISQATYPLQKVIRLSLSGLCVVLVLILWFELDRVDVDKTNTGIANTGVTPINTDPDLAEFVFHNITAFDEVIQRPLFNENRLPFVAPEPEQIVTKPKRMSRQAVKKQEPLSLSAVVMTPDTKIAILQSGRDKTLQRVMLGETIDGWILNEVSAHSIQLKKGEEIKELELEIKGATVNPVKKSKPESKPVVKADTGIKTETPEKQDLIEKELTARNPGSETIVD